MRTKSVAVSAALIILGAVCIAVVFALEPRGSVVFELPKDAAALAQHEARHWLAMALAVAGPLIVAGGCLLALRSAKTKQGTRFATDGEIKEAEAEFASLKQENPTAHTLLIGPGLRQRKTIDPKLGGRSK